MQTVYIIRGLAGSGKSTLAKILEESLPDAAICSADLFFIDKDGVYRFEPASLPVAHSWCRARFMKNKGRENIIVDNTHAEEQHFDFYLTCAKAWGYRVISLVVENRHGGVSQHNVPEHTIERMRGRFQIKL